MEELLVKIRKCDICQAHLPLGPRPIIAASPKSKIILASQAPGRLAHVHNKAWDDPSGRKLREWLGVSDEEFYNTDNFAILPTGFCYPGKGKTGDLPPRRECAPLWHKKVWRGFEDVHLTLLIGKYAQDRYLGEKGKKNLTENVKSFTQFLPEFFPLPHPSPVNRFWRIKNPWFEEEVVPELQRQIRRYLNC